MNACYKCKKWQVWTDEDGKAHSCREGCEEYQNDQKRMDVARKNRRTAADENDTVARAMLRLAKQKHFRK